MDFDAVLQGYQTALETTLRRTIEASVAAQVKSVTDATTAQRIAEVATVAKERDTWAERAAALETYSTRLERRNEELCGQFTALLESLRHNISRGNEVLRVSELVLARCSYRSMDGKMDGRMDERLDKRLDKRLDERLDERLGESSEEMSEESLDERRRRRSRSRSPMPSMRTGGSSPEE